VITWLASLALLVFVMAATPGPNNILFAASGAHVGYRRTVPGLLGMLGGFAVILAACALGIGAVVPRGPAAQTSTTGLMSCYMVWLGLRLWRAPASGPGRTEAGMLTWQQMAALQLLNPKTWIACLAFTSGYLANNSPGGLGIDLVGVATFLSVVLISASLWTLFGATLRARLRPQHWQIFNRSLAVLACAAVLTFWL
jgi:threonine/homoserine/homoserine lactone efflux protein